MRTKSSSSCSSWCRTLSYLSQQDAGETAVKMYAVHGISAPLSPVLLLTKSYVGGMGYVSRVLHSDGSARVEVTQKGVRRLYVPVRR